MRQCTKCDVRSTIMAFTLLELIIVVVLIGIIAGFAIPNYGKAIQKAHERDMLMQLMALHAANVMYRANAGTYWDTGGGAQTNLATINSTLGINIISSDGTTYSYTGAAGGGSFTADADWDAYTLRVNGSAINTSATPPNPCCLVGPCLTLGAC